MKPNPEQLPALLPEPTEARPLAAEMAAAHRQMVETYREHYKATLQEALDRADQPLDPHCEKRIRSCAPDQVSWFNLHQLAKPTPICRPGDGRKSAVGRRRTPKRSPCRQGS